MSNLVSCNRICAPRREPSPIPNGACRLTVGGSGGFAEEVPAAQEVERLPKESLRSMRGARERSDLVVDVGEHVLIARDILDVGLEDFR
jgi:hypothetical protein